MATWKNTAQLVCGLLLLGSLAACKKETATRERGPAQAADAATLATKESPQEEPKTTEATPEATSPDATTEKQSEVPPGSPVVTLLDPGQEPRRALRFTLTPGATFNSVFTMGMDMQMQIEGLTTPPAPKTPPIIMEAEGKIHDVSPTGEADYSLTITRADVQDDPAAPPAVVGAIRSNLKGLEGLSNSATITDRGFVKNAQVSIPPTVPPEIRQVMEGMQQSLSQMTRPLPEEPIGVGARWEVEYLVSQNIMTVKQTAEVTLTALEGDVLTLSVKINQTADPQKINPPGMLPGSSAYLNSFTSSGEGITVLDLNKVLPTTGEMSVNSDMRMQIEIGSQKQEMSMKMGTTLKLESK